MHERSAGDAHDLLIIQRTEALPPKIVDSLQRKGFSLRLVKTPQEATHLVGDVRDPILVIFCGNRPGALDYLKFFIPEAELHEFPVLILTTEVEGVEGELNKYFGLATALQIPCPPDDVVEALNFICRVYRKGAAVAQWPAGPVATESQKTGTSVEVVPPPQQQEVDSLAHEIIEHAESIPNLFFEQLQNFGLLRRSLGGENYPRQQNKSVIDLSAILPIDTQLNTFCRGVLDECGKWGSMHLNRTAYLTSILLEPLGFDKELREAAKHCAFLFAYAFGKDHRPLLRKEYQGRGQVLLRKEICSFIKDSALQISTFLKLQHETQILLKMARLIGREEVVSDEPISVVASALMAAELTDRTCYQSGHWNCRAAYAMIRKIKGGKIRDVHPAVLSCLVKILAEGIGSKASATLIKKSIREDPELNARARANKECSVEGNEEKVSLASLSPGMKLSRPLYAFDGRMILDEDLILDQDLIFRIWQLSAVRPLNAPVIIRNQEPE